MGTSATVGQFTGKLDKLGKELADTDRPLTATALRGKQIFLASAAAAGVLGSTPAGKRKRVGARYDTKNKKSSLGVGTVVIFYTGPAHLTNNPTRAHQILPRRRVGSRTRRKQAAKALRFPDGDFASSAPHPGTSGKHYYERARAICEQALPRTYASEGLTAALRRVF
jgi:hypothetical protein